MYEILDQAEYKFHFVLEIKFYITMFEILRSVLIKPENKDTRF